MRISICRRCGTLCINPFSIYQRFLKAQAGDEQAEMPPKHDQARTRRQHIKTTAVTLIEGDGLGLAPGGNINDRPPAASKAPLPDPNTEAADLGGSANTQQ